MPQATKPSSGESGSTPGSRQVQPQAQQQRQQQQQQQQQQIKQKVTETQPQGQPEIKKDELKKESKDEEPEVVVIKQEGGSDTRAALAARLAQARKERDQAEKLLARIRAVQHQRQSQQPQTVAAAGMVTTFSRNTPDLFQV